MEGYIKTYLPGKGYGFIVGEDGNDYFVHKNDFQKPSDVRELRAGDRIRFEETATPKGYQAKACTRIASSETATYTVPAKTLATKARVPSGWQILESSDWMVTGSGYDSLDVAMRELTKRAETVGANALVEVRQVHEQYSARTFIGRPVNVAKLAPNGTKTKSDFQSLEATLSKAYEKEREKETRAGIWNRILWLGVLLGCGFFIYAGAWPLSAIPVLAGIIFTATTRSWLIAMPSGESDYKTL